MASFQHQIWDTHVPPSSLCCSATASPRSPSTNWERLCPQTGSPSADQKPSFSLVHCLQLFGLDLLSTINTLLSPSPLAQFSSPFRSGFRHCPALLSLLIYILDPDVDLVLMLPCGLLQIPDLVFPTRTLPSTCAPPLHQSGLPSSKTTLPSWHFLRMLPSLSRSATKPCHYLYFDRTTSNQPSRTIKSCWSRMSFPFSHRPLCSCFSVRLRSAIFFALLPAGSEKS